MTVTHRMLYILLATLLLSWWVIPGVWAEESSQVLTKQAMDECHEGRRAKEETARVAHFERGRKLAETAVGLDERSADAHFALFCNIGERMRANGEVLFSVFEYGRMMEALDKTLLLNPNHMDALSSKGTILIEVPGLFGGDSEKGEAILRQVIQQDPESINARMVVARSCAERGEDQEAFDLAKKALELARAGNRDDLLPEAEKTFSEIQTKLASK
ncbi:tetratricopeptide repeat protein [Nitrospira sp. T9]|uniref:tetratricopeptide repeat protein n=1 Tax=unclassified Nitrospira TaxID=2652172 RepID=UPI003F981AB4